MAKRAKTRPKESEPISGDPVFEDAWFENAVEESSAKRNKAGRPIGEPCTCVLPVPAISTRYLLQNEGWPLSKVSIISGPPKSYKSTFAIEVGRWHVQSNGRIYRCEVESKENVVLRNSVLHWAVNRIKSVHCGSLEDWQRSIIWTTVSLQKHFNSVESGRTIPICEIIDSIMGQASERTIDKIDKEGHANKHFADEAASIADFMRSFPQKLVGWPFSLIGVSHVKYRQDSKGNPIRYEPGGVSSQYQLAFDIETQQMGKPVQKATKDGFPYVEATLMMRTILNSYGPHGKTIFVPLTFWQQEDTPGVMRLYSRFEWWQASISLLVKGKGMDDTTSAILLPRIKEACGIMERSGGNKGLLYSSKILGVSAEDAIPAHDMGVLLESRPDVLSQLYSILGIERQPFFQPGVDYMKQLNAQENALGQQEDGRTRKEVASQLIDDGYGEVPESMLEEGGDPLGALIGE